jgi:hypothetical protein
MQVVNPAAMQVRVLANQQDFPILRVGQTAKVRLDAYPELVFPAKLEADGSDWAGGRLFEQGKDFRGDPFAGREQPKVDA